MCGVAGAMSLSASGCVEPWALGHMRHRGPDGEGVAVSPDGGPTLEHCRLAIIDPANPQAAQPFRDPSGRFTIVYNGELFNYEELRRDLATRGPVFTTQSDTEVVLHAVATLGVESLTRFRGMFAFLCWDADRRELLAARDQIGVKPLYYTVVGNTFLAASELRTLLRHPAVRPTLDPSAVVEYLSFGFVSGSRTLVQGVHKLPPGHVLRVRAGVVHVDEYWDVLSSAPSERNGSNPVPELLDRLGTAVARSLVSDVPVSLMLSGGLDSSTVATLAASRPGDLTAYSVSFGLETDESAVASRLANDLGIRHRELRLTSGLLAEGFEDWLRTLDVPTANPTWIAVSAIARAVRNDGIKVLLSGDGGDELFGGYSRWMRYLRFYDRIWAPTPGFARRATGRAARPLVRGLAKDIARRARDDGQLFVGSRPFHDDDLDNCLGPVGREAAQSEPPERAVAVVRERFDERRPGGDQLAWMSYLALKTDLVEDYLVRLDTMGMTHSVEGRVPLLDVDLAEFALGLPQQVKVGTNYAQKALFRTAVSSALPSYVTARRKQGFCPPVADWASTLLRSRVPTASVLVDEGLVAPGAIELLERRGSPKASFGLWALGTLAVWCETNL